jgi:putative intracellular protease/amidase
MHAYKLLSLIAATLFVTVICAVPATLLAAGMDETAMFRYNAQRTGDYNPVAGSSTPNGQLK